MSYTIVQNFITDNRTHQPLTPIGMVLHDTDCKGATDENEQSYFSHNNVGASAHVFIDWDSITQTIPYNEVAWHAGYTANHKFLGVELCVPYGHSIAQFTEVYNRAVWFFAYAFINIIKQIIISKNDLMSHAETSDLYKETDHQDPLIFFNEYGKTVDGFRADVQKEINNQLGKSNFQSTPILVKQYNIDNVKKVQIILNSLNMKGSNGKLLVTDGIFGSQTISALPIIKYLDKRFPTLIKLIQQILLSKGYKLLKYGCDGDYGVETGGQLTNFQKANGIITNGEVHQDTWEALLS